MATPSQRDIKRLFALSGNRCAFPKCQSAIVQDGGLIGEVCHIKADKPGGPRYDSTQTEAERQTFQNLMLMCANHHKVVDDDVEAYTVERLMRMKAAHESATKPLEDASSTQIAVQLLIDQSIASSGQTGGISAHTIHAQTINMNNNSTGNLKQTKSLQATELLWKTLCALKSEFGDVIFLDTILTPKEIDAAFKGGETNAFFQAVSSYANLPHVTQKMAKVLPKDSEEQRLFVSQRAWGLYITIATLYGRAGMLLTLSFKENSLRDWRKDEILDQSLRLALPANEVENAKQQVTGGLNILITQLERAFLNEVAVSRY